MEGGGGYGANPGVCLVRLLGARAPPPPPSPLHHISCSNLIPWLVYHKLENGGYCLPCFLFAALASWRQSYDHISKGIELIRKHADMGHHKEAVVRCTLPITTCSAERSFSELLLMKTALCSCMTSESITSPYTLRHPY